MKRLSQIECLPVFDADGRKLGHVWDLRTVPGDTPQGRAIASFLIGSVGWIKRIGIKLRADDRIKAADVSGIQIANGIRLRAKR